jgi:tetratricopeptide (TPR) repeat protein
MDDAKAGHSMRRHARTASRRVVIFRATVRSLLLLLAAATAACATTTSASNGAKSQSVDPLEQVSPQQLYEQGKALVMRGDALRAEQYLSAAAARGYPADRVLPLLMRVCISTSRLGAALQYARPHLQLHPDDYHLRYLVAAVELGLGHPADAERELGLVLQQAPDYAEAHYLMGVLLRDHRNDAAAAASHFAEHQRLNPNGLHGAEVAAWLREHAARDGVGTGSVPEASTAPETGPSTSDVKNGSAP